MKLFCQPAVPATVSHALMGMLLLVTGDSRSVFGAASDASRGPSTPSEMTRMVVRLKGSQVKPGSFAALPKTIYNALPHYARIEDPPDPRQHQQKLTVIAGDDVYSANLLEHKGTHVREPGAGKDGQLPIVLLFDPSKRLGPLDGIQFGDEYQFFSQAGAKRGPGPSMNGKATDLLRLETPLGPAELTLLGGSEVPVALRWPTSEGVLTYEYLEYGDLPFNPKLFERPPGIQWKEALSPAGVR